MTELPDDADGQTAKPEDDAMQFVAQSRVSDLPLIDSDTHPVDIDESDGTHPGLDTEAMVEAVPVSIDYSVPEETFQLPGQSGVPLGKDGSKDGLELSDTGLRSGEVIPADQGRPGDDSLAVRGRPGEADLPDQRRSGEADLPDQGRPGEVELPDQGRPGEIELPVQGRSGEVDLPDQRRPGEADLPEQVHPGETDLPDQRRPGEADLPDQVHPGEADLTDQGRPGEVALQDQGRPAEVELQDQGRRSEGELPDQERPGEVDPSEQGRPGEVELSDMGRPGEADLTDQERLGEAYLADQGRPSVDRLSDQGRRDGAELPDQGHPGEFIIPEQSSSEIEPPDQVSLKLQSRLGEGIGEPDDTDASLTYDVVQPPSADQAASHDAIPGTGVEYMELLEPETASTATTEPNQKLARPSEDTLQPTVCPEEDGVAATVKPPVDSLTLESAVTDLPSADDADRQKAKPEDDAMKFVAQSRVSDHPLDTETHTVDIDESTTEPDTTVSTEREEDMLSMYRASITSETADSYTAVVSYDRSPDDSSDVELETPFLDDQEWPEVPGTEVGDDTDGQPGFASADRPDVTHPGLDTEAMVEAEPVSIDYSAPEETFQLPAQSDLPPGRDGSKGGQEPRRSDAGLCPGEVIPADQGRLAEAIPGDQGRPGDDSRPDHGRFGAYSPSDQGRPDDVILPRRPEEGTIPSATEDLHPMYSPKSTEISDVFQPRWAVSRDSLVGMEGFGLAEHRSCDSNEEVIFDADMAEIGEITLGPSDEEAGANDLAAFPTQEAPCTLSDDDRTDGGKDKSDPDKDESWPSEPDILCIESAYTTDPGISRPQETLTYQGIAKSAVGEGKCDEHTVDIIEQCPRPTLSAYTTSENGYDEWRRLRKQHFIIEEATLSYKGHIIYTPDDVEPVETDKRSEADGDDEGRRDPFSVDGRKPGDSTHTLGQDDRVGSQDSSQFPSQHSDNCDDVMHKAPESTSLQSGPETSLIPGTDGVLNLEDSVLRTSAGFDPSTEEGYPDEGASASELQVEAAASFSTEAGLPGSVREIPRGDHNEHSASEADPSSGFLYPESGAASSLPDGSGASEAGGSETALEHGVTPSELLDDQLMARGTHATMQSPMSAQLLSMSPEVGSQETDSIDRRPTNDSGISDVSGVSAHDSIAPRHPSVSESHELSRNSFAVEGADSSTIDSTELYVGSVKVADVLSVGGEVLKVHMDRRPTENKDSDTLHVVEKQQLSERTIYLKDYDLGEPVIVSRSSEQLPLESHTTSSEEERPDGSFDTHLIHTEITEEKFTTSIEYELSGSESDENDGDSDDEPVECDFLEEGEDDEASEDEPGSGGISPNEEVPKSTSGTLGRSRADGIPSSEEQPPVHFSAALHLPQNSQLQESVSESDIFEPEKSQMVELDAPVGQPAQVSSVHIEFPKVVMPVVPYTSHAEFIEPYPEQPRVTGESVIPLPYLTHELQETRNPQSTTSNELVGIVPIMDDTIESDQTRVQEAEPTSLGTAHGSEVAPCDETSQVFSLQLEFPKVFMPVVPYTSHIEHIEPYPEQPRVTGDSVIPLPYPTHRLQETNDAQSSTPRKIVPLTGDTIKLDQADGSAQEAEPNFLDATDGSEVTRRDETSQVSSLQIEFPKALMPVVPYTIHIEYIESYPEQPQVTVESVIPLPYPTHKLQNTGYPQSLTPQVLEAPQTQTLYADSQAPVEVVSRGPTSADAYHAEQFIHAVRSQFAPHVSSLPVQLVGRPNSDKEDHPLKPSDLSHDPIRSCTPYESMLQTSSKVELEEPLQLAVDNPSQAVEGMPSQTVQDTPSWRVAPAQNQDKVEILEPKPHTYDLGDYPGHEQDSQHTYHQIYLHAPPHFSVAEPKTARYIELHQTEQNPDARHSEISDHPNTIQQPGYYHDAHTEPSADREPHQETTSHTCDHSEAIVLQSRTAYEEGWSACERGEHDVVLRRRTVNPHVSTFMVRPLRPEELMMLGGRYPEVAREPFIMIRSGRSTGRPTGQSVTSRFTAELPHQSMLINAATIHELEDGSDYLHTNLSVADKFSNVTVNRYADLTLHRPEPHHLTAALPNQTSQLRHMRKSLIASYPSNKDDLHSISTEKSTAYFDASERSTVVPLVHESLLSSEDLDTPDAERSESNLISSARPSYRPSEQTCIHYTSAIPPVKPRQRSSPGRSAQTPYIANLVQKQYASYQPSTFSRASTGRWGDGSVVARNLTTVHSNADHLDRSMLADGSVEVKQVFTYQTYQHSPVSVVERRCKNEQLTVRQGVIGDGGRAVHVLHLSGPQPKQGADGDESTQ